MPNQKAYFVNSDVVGAVFHHTKKKTRIIMNHQEPQVPSTCFLHGDEIIFVSVNLFLYFWANKSGANRATCGPGSGKGAGCRHLVWYGMAQDNCKWRKKTSRIFQKTEKPEMGPQISCTPGKRYD
jgi:hypothetical protein